RIGTTPAQKSLFFNLRRLRARIGASPVGGLTDEQRNRIARELGVPVEAVERMEAHMSRPDRSLNATIGDDDGDELQDFLPYDGPSPEEIVGERHDDAVRVERLHKALDTLTPRE